MTDTTRWTPGQQYQHTHPVKADVRDCPACTLRATAPRLVEALESGIAEAVTLKARLPDPYAANLAKWITEARAALAAAEGKGQL